MSYWFDKSRQRWKIRIKRAGKEIARSLPAGITRNEAERIHADLIKEFMVGMPRREALKSMLWISDRDQAVWQEEVERAFGNNESWLHNLRAALAKRHRHKGLPGSIIGADALRNIALECRGRCVLSGLKLIVPGRGPVTPATASVDRIDTAKGYVAGNCRIVALAVNLAMQRWGDEVFKRICYGVVAREFF